MGENKYTADTREELAALQRVFFSLVTSPLIEGDRLRDDSRIARLISPNARLSEKERIELYAQQYWWRVIPSLEEDYSGVQALLGREAFRELAKEYLIACPSSSFTLRHLGRRFPEFLRLQQLPVSVRLVHELALFESHQIDSFFAKEHENLGRADLSSINEHSQLVRQPHAFLMESHFPLDTLSQLVKKPTSKDNESNATSLRPEETSVTKPEVNVINENEDPVQILIYRYCGAVYAKTISSLEWQILSALEHPTSLEGLISNISQHPHASPESIGAAFESLGKLRVIAVL